MTEAHDPSVQKSTLKGAIKVGTLIALTIALTILGSYIWYQIVCAIFPLYPLCRDTHPFHINWN